MSERPSGRRRSGGCIEIGTGMADVIFVVLMIVVFAVLGLVAWGVELL
ncbi:MAG: hypothetical protein ACRDR6_29260 [Pseudonocardiaceae bacterium]